MNRGGKKKTLMQKHSASRGNKNLPERSNVAKAEKPGIIKDAKVGTLLKPKWSCYRNSLYYVLAQR